MAHNADQPAAVYGLESQARALASVAGEADAVQFFVGTLSPRSDNQLHLLLLDEDDNSVTGTIFGHPAGEIWHIASCPVAAHKDVVATVHSTGTRVAAAATLWRVDAEKESAVRGSVCPMDRLVELAGHASAVQCVVWHPTRAAQLVTVDENVLRVWDVAVGAATASVAKQGGPPRVTDSAPFVACTWNPHHGATAVGTTAGPAAVGWDLRSMTQTFAVPNAHQGTARNIDFNPNKQYDFATCGDDGFVKLWDARAPTTPTVMFGAHSHWVWSVQYNTLKDQLLLSCGSDGKVILANAATLSSDAAAAQRQGDDHGLNLPTWPDGTLCAFEEHEDSVYCAAWSAADPWVFASLSFDGRVVMSHVPKEKKYTLLLAGGTD